MTLISVVAIFSCLGAAIFAVSVIYNTILNFKDDATHLK
jgi:hypothetical protein